MISHTAQISDMLKQAHLGVLFFQAIVGDAPDDLLKIIDTESIKMRSEWTTDAITSRGQIAAARKAYRACGKDPSRYRPSADSLMRRIIKGNNLYKVNNVVDALNLISLQTGFSIGGYDADKIEGEIIFDTGKANDEYYGIGRGLLNIEDLPVLRDQKGSFGSPTSDSQRTMITESATNILFVFFDFDCSDKLNEWMQKCEDLLAQYCSGAGFKKELIIISEKL